MTGRWIALVRRSRGRRWVGAPALGAVVAIAVVALATTGGSSHHRSVPTAPTAAVPAPSATGAPAARRLLIGLTELNANLLWHPNAGQGVPADFGYGRELLSALHPDFVRLVVNWSALQSTAGSAARLDAPVDGCARGVAPCGVYSGVRSELSAIASQQRAGGGSQVVIVIADVPGWAAQPPWGCERSGTTAVSRPIRPAALVAYRSLIRSLLALGRSVGVSLPWWTPWNEPNHPAFVSPQRAICSAAAPSLSSGVYTELARAMADELAVDGGGHRILLGELSGLTVSSPLTTGITEFVADLPSDVVCASDTWSVHAYPGQRSLRSPVRELESALDARGACGRRAHIWVTETGAGAARAGDPRTPGRRPQIAGCQAMAALLAGWNRDPRVDAAFQYEFRDDTRFPVGLINAQLNQLYPAYYLWLAWAGARPPGGPPPLPRACT